MRRTQSGFTLIELLIVISIIGVLAAVLLPRVLESRQAAYAEADRAQLRTHFTWLEVYRSKHSNFLPSEGGFKFVLSTWTSKIFDHTPENLDKYFTPGQTDPVWAKLNKEMSLGNDPWPDIQSVTSEDTHYVGRAKDKLRSATQGAEEAWMANDNESVWSLADGTINVLFNGGTVRGYSYPQLVELFGLGDMDKANPVQTWGPNSPIPACRSLDN